MRLDSSTCPDSNVLRNRAFSGPSAPSHWSLKTRQTGGSTSGRYEKRHLLPNHFTSGASQGGLATIGQSATLVYTTEQTRTFGEGSMLSRSSRATSSAEKSRPGIQNRGFYSSVSLGSKKSVQSGKSAPPSGAVVDDGLRGPALCTDSASSCFCLSPSA